MFAATMLLALAIDAAIGWPDALYRRIGHPVGWLGRLIAMADQALNRPEAPGTRRRIAGLALALGLILLTAGAADILAALVPPGWGGTLWAGLLAWPLLAARSLDDHVARVASPLARGDLAGARKAVSMIVGRDPESLDEAGVARAALESLAESTCDGVVAPLFWGVIFGLPGLAAYKAINTMDSMIGHLTPRHAAFGWAAARIDDAVNWIPARLTALVYLALARRNRRAAWAAMWADAGHHRSPNAGWPEAALAGALGVRLSGPRVYNGEPTQDAWVNGDAPDPTPAELSRGLALYRRLLWALGAALFVFALP